jgi:hypothetical protein
VAADGGDGDAYQPERPKRLFEDFNVRPVVQGLVGLTVAFLGVYLYKGRSPRRPAQPTLVPTQITSSL